MEDQRSQQCGLLFSGPHALKETINNDHGRARDDLSSGLNNAYV